VLVAKSYNAGFSPFAMARNSSKLAFLKEIGTENVLVTAGFIRFKLILRKSLGRQIERRILWHFQGCNVNSFKVYHPLRRLHLILPPPF
jgi:hypothetical protein